MSHYVFRGKIISCMKFLGEYHLLPQEGAPGIWGEHINLGDKKGEHKRFFLLKGEQKILIKKIFYFYSPLVLKYVQKPFF